MQTPPYTLSLPNIWNSALVVSSPHSGAIYTKEFIRNSILRDSDLRSSEDAFVDELVSASPEFGAPLLSATMPRAFVDLNRNRNELDSAMIKGAPLGRNNPRVASGLGVIPRVVAEGRAIQLGKISMAEAEQRLKEYYDPYHARLDSMLQQSRAAFGEVLLLDFHSMPHDALQNVVVKGRRKPGIVLGDRFGASASLEKLEKVEAAFEAEGFAVSRNTPFAGASILRRYGKPGQGLHAIQVEIDRALYMDERRIRKLRQFSEVKARITNVLRWLAQSETGQVPIAAE